MGCEMSDYEKLTDSEIDRLVIEKVFGDRYDEKTRTWFRPDGLPYFSVTAWCESDNSARLVRSRIAELNLEEYWAEVLLRLAGLAPDDLGGGMALFRLINTTPRQQCVAALMALGVKP